MSWFFNKKILAIASLVAVFALAGCGASSSQNQTDQGTQGTQQEQQTDQTQGGDTTGGTDGEAVAFDESKAKETYSASCAGCHGANMEGGFGTALNDVGSRLDANAIYDIIKNGRGQMPAQGQVSDEDAKNVAAWLASLK